MWRARTADSELYVELADTAWAFAMPMRADEQLFAALFRKAAEARVLGQELANTALSFATTTQSDEQLLAAV